LTLTGCKRVLRYSIPKGRTSGHQDQGKVISSARLGLGVVLIVDDRPEERDAARLCLREAADEDGLSFRFQETGNGREGPAAWRSVEPGCILLENGCTYQRDHDGQITLCSKPLSQSVPSRRRRVSREWLARAVADLAKPRSGWL
jgi:hypothetical protein